MIREQQGYTQDEAAERLEVSPDTIAGWETGRRSLTALPVGQMLGLRHRLMQMRISPALLQTLERALEADVLLASVLDNKAAVEESPLGAMVMQRELAEVLAWPLIGVPPRSVRTLPAPPRPRRGPAPTGPELTTAERQTVFARLRHTAEQARGPGRFLLRRQALYLSGYDVAADAGDWLAHQQRTERPGLAHRLAQHPFRGRGRGPAGRSRPHVVFHRHRAHGRRRRRGRELGVLGLLDR